MDLTQAGISAVLSVGAGAITAVLARARKSGSEEKERETIKEDVRDHGKRLDEHDDRFEALNQQFVPRQELKETMDAIQKSQDRAERWLEALIMPRINPIGAAFKSMDEK